MATVAKGVATFTQGGAENQSFSWVDAVLGTPVTFGSVPTIIGGPSAVVTAGEGPGDIFFAGAGAVTTTGGTLTCANPPDMTVTVTAIG